MDTFKCKVLQPIIAAKNATKETVSRKEEDEAVYSLFEYVNDPKEASKEKASLGTTYCYSTKTYVIAQPGPIETLKEIGGTLNQRLYYSEWHTLKPQVQRFPTFEEALTSCKVEGLKWLKKYDVEYSCLVLRAGVDLDLVIKKAVKYVQQDCQSDDPLKLACHFFVRFYRMAYLCECHMHLCSRRRS